MDDRGENKDKDQRPLQKKTKRRKSNYIFIIVFLAAVSYLAYPSIKYRIDTFLATEKAIDRTDILAESSDSTKLPFEVDGTEHTFATPLPYVVPSAKPEPQEAEASVTEPTLTAELKPATEPTLTAELKPATEPPFALEDMLDTVVPTAFSIPELKEISEMRRDYFNQEIVGYIVIDGTNISYPVVQASDNDFYLNHGLYGTEDVAGAIFMDFENSAKELDSNTVIYGHNMKNGTMFHNLRYYREKGFYETHKYILLKTQYEETVWEIFAFYVTTPDFFYIQTEFEDEAQFFGLLLQMKLKSIYETGVTVSKTDKILTLSTCYGLDGEERYVVNAKLIK